jgi:hypothetical protein
MPPRKPKSQPAPKTQSSPRASLARKVDGYVKKPTYVPKKAAPATNPRQLDTRASRKRPAEDEEEQPNPYPIKYANPCFKRHYKISRGTLWREDAKPEDIEELAKKIQADSPSHATWGNTSQNLIVGNKRKNRKGTAVRPGANGRIMTYAEMMEDMAASTRKPIIPNSLERSPILRIPLEVRERIYAYLLKYPKPILLKPNWVTPERNNYLSHALLRTCKQFEHECTSFLYTQNTFQALLRPSTTRQRMYDDVSLLPVNLHHLFRHVVLDFAKECWSIDWFEKTASSLDTLIAAKPALDSLTLILSPKKVGMSTTALGMQANPIAFADFLWDAGAVMQAVSKLCPRTLKVVVKKGSKKFGIEVDMWCLRMLMGGHWEGANEVGVRMAEDRGVMVREELGDLKARFKEVFEDDEAAVAMGRCKVLGEEEGAGPKASMAVQEGASSGGGGAAAVSSTQSSVGGEAIASLASRSSSADPSGSTSMDEDAAWSF